MINKLIFIYIFKFLSIAFALLCGHSDHFFRIISGNETSIHEYPWMAFMEIDYIVPNEKGKNESWYDWCGASLIDDRWLLTAAHCWDDMENATKITVRIRLGAHNISSKQETGLVKQVAQKYIIHPLYNNKDDRAYNDIALVMLNKSIDFSTHKTIQQICLPVQGVQVNHDECYIAGWGYTDKNNSVETSVLMHAKVPVVSNELCGSAWNISESQVCAGGQVGGPDTCSGDSGGPLQCPLANGVWVLYGITSYGDDNCGVGDPTVYTKVEPFIDWINKVRLENQ